MSLAINVIKQLDGERHVSDHLQMNRSSSIKKYCVFNFN
jgi:hypothetical protein